ncbi:hypothetical protein C3H43_09260 [Campylobacter jejuni]|uniref:replication initiation protein n=1 Tax=Campylobacter jejuni TaxID=197 RepID=UPI000F80FDB9|nr:replication initiation protein [Campylobacter jejuni]RTJ92162.1 hypothetical protein C3H43_09260 [Campylobacter jejuni]
MDKNTEIVVLDRGFTRNQSNVSNVIASARTKMTTLELQAFYQTTTLINMNDTDFNEYEISVNDFSRALNIGNTNREQIIKLCKSLLRQVFEIEQENGDYMGYTIFSRMHYKHKEQVINIRFNNDFKPFLLQLKQFTKIEQVGYIKNFTSKYAIRFYTLLKDYRKMTYRDFSIKSLNKILILPKSYENYTNFYQRVLKPAIDEINAKSDLRVNEPSDFKKSGKKITGFRLYFSYKNDEITKNKIKAVKSNYKKWGFRAFKNEKIMIGDNIFTINEIIYHEQRYKCISNQNENILSTPFKNEMEKMIFSGIEKLQNEMLKSEKKEKVELNEFLEEKDEKEKKRNFAKMFLGLNDSENKNIEEETEEQKYLKFLKNMKAKEFRFEYDGKLWQFDDFDFYEFKIIATELVRDEYEDLKFATTMHFNAKDQEQFFKMVDTFKNGYKPS